MLTRADGSSTIWVAAEGVSKQQAPRMTPLIIAERQQRSLVIITRVFNQSCAQQMQRWRNVAGRHADRAELCRLLPSSCKAVFRVTPGDSCQKRPAGHMSQMELFNGIFSKITNQYSVLHIPKKIARKSTGSDSASFDRISRVHLNLQLCPSIIQNRMLRMFVPFACRLQRVCPFLG